MASPAATPINIVAGQTTTVTANFIQLGGLRVTTAGTISASTIFVDGHPMDDWGCWTYLTPGLHTVSFEAIQGLNNPPSLQVTLVAGSTVHVEGNYSTGQTTVIS
jgi:hypothetical protein